MNLWLDDIRQPPSVGLWHWVKNYDEAINALNDHRWEWASLDHDLAEAHYTAWRNRDVQMADFDQAFEAGLQERTGYDVALWMAEHNVWPTQGVSVHSFNRVGAERICGVVNRYGPYTDICVWTPRDLKGDLVPAQLVP